MSEQQKDVAGTLFRGADGSLYFIPDTYLPTFRVFKSAQKKVEGLLKDRRDAATQTSEEADAETAPDVATLGADTAEAAKQRPNTRLAAVHATIAIPVPDPKGGTIQAGIISASVQSEIE